MIIIPKFPSSYYFNFINIMMILIRIILCCWNLLNMIVDKNGISMSTTIGHLCFLMQWSKPNCSTHAHTCTHILTQTQKVACQNTDLIFVCVLLSGSL